MKLNLAVSYGLAATGYLATHADRDWVSGSEIAEECHIPPEFLAKLLQEMGRHDIVTGKRGPKGGFRLARPAEEISLLEVIEAAHGPIAHTESISKMTVDTPLSRNFEKVCKQASDKAVSILSNASVNQMVG